MKTHCKRMRYDCGFKLKCVAFAKSATNSAAAAKFKISEKLIRDWKKNEEHLLLMPRHKCARRGGKIHWKKLEEHLGVWVHERLDRGVEVSRSEVCGEADLWAKRNPGESVSFTSNISWCRRFLQRQSLQLNEDGKVCRRVEKKFEPNYEEDSDCVDIVEIDFAVIQELSVSEGIEIDFLEL